jgi:sterol desaturase/sphingolipid hydroxylase (fatty acid hydroxylase superfamily)
MSWVTLFIVVDFVYYWFHRASHRIRLFWAAHVNHHSSEHMNFATALRQSWTVPFTRIVFYWPICLIGFHPLALMTMGAVTIIAAFWVHTDHIRKLWWPIEFVFVTPSHHRVHHGSNEQYLDKNYGNVLIIWDRMFGTFEPEREKVRYGLTRNINTYNPIHIAFHEWSDMIRGALRASSLKEMARQIFGPPSDLENDARALHDGSEPPVNGVER